MSLQKGNISQTNAVEIGSGPTAPLHNLPTLDVSASGTLNLASIQCVNFIKGVSVVLQSAALVKNQLVLFIATGAIGPARMSLDNGGTIAGSSVYTLAGPVQFIFDGTNLS